MAQDATGFLWVGTEGGLARYDGHEFRSFLHHPGDPAALADPFVRRVLADPSGVIWVGTGNGLQVLDPARSAFTHTYRRDELDEHRLSHDLVTVLSLDRGRRLWVGTEQGLNRLETRSGTVTRYGEKDGLGYATVFSLHEDRGGLWWIGTGGGGMTRMDRKTRRRRTFTVRDGLPSNTICGVVEDAAGDLWLSTTRGICHFDPRAEKVMMRFDTTDGLQDPSFAHSPAAHDSGTGEVFFGGRKNGFNAFYPRSIRRDRYTPQVVVARSLHRFREVDLGSLLDPAGVMRLAYDDVVSLELAALSYESTAGNQLRYRLKGLHPEWIPIEADRIVSLSGVPPGRYAMTVEGANHHGAWNSAGVKLDVVVRPPC